MRIDIGGEVRLFFDVEGLGLAPNADGGIEERPTILLVHGGPGIDHRGFKHSALRALRDLGQLVYYDQRGHGRSDRRTPDEWNLDTWADDIVALCTALDIERPIVIGTSFGGFVAQRYLARHPDHAAKVALVCTAPRLDLDAVACAFAERAGAGAGEIARRQFLGDPAPMAEFFDVCLPAYSVEPLDLTAMAAMGLPDGEMLRHFERGEHQSMDLGPGLENATCPVLVLSGLLDPVMPMAIVEEMIAHLPTGLTRFEVLPHASHLDVGGPAGLAVLRDFLAD